jgi:hypothetical protein
VSDARGVHVTPRVHEERTIARRVLVRLGDDGALGDGAVQDQAGELVGHTPLALDHAHQPQHDRAGQRGEQGEHTLTPPQPPERRRDI